MTLLVTVPAPARRAVLAVGLVLAFAGGAVGCVRMSGAGPKPPPGASAAATRGAVRGPGRALPLHVAVPAHAARSGRSSARPASRSAPAGPAHGTAPGGPAAPTAPGVPHPPVTPTTPAAPSGPDGPTGGQPSDTASASATPSGGQPSGTAEHQAGRAARRRGR